MSDVFISYAKEDRESARLLAALLEEASLSVWWDRVIPTGSKFADVIGEEIDAARAVVVLWSSHSVGSDWVEKEARRGQTKLFPVLLEDVAPPWVFEDLHACDLTGWTGDRESSDFLRLLSDLKRVGLSPLRADTPADAPEGQAEAPQSDRPERRPAAGARRWRISLASAGLVILLVMVWVLWKSSQSDDSSPAAQPEASNRRPASSPAEIIIGSEGSAGLAGEPPLLRAHPCLEDELNPCVLIELGEFKMGSPEGVGLGEERPQHEVELSAFYIQRHEVTNEEYRRFREDHRFPPGKDRHPVVNVSWSEARAYATQWLGGDLPTEAQWEFAARGPKGREYPWIEVGLTPDHANHGGDVGDTTSVGSHPKGATPEGIEDMAGNVWEWCRDWRGPYTRNRQIDPEGPENSSSRALRGGSFKSRAKYLRGAYRTARPLERRAEDLGFRVVWSSSGELD